MVKDSRIETTGHNRELSKLLHLTQSWKYTNSYVLIQFQNLQTAMMFIQKDSDEIAWIVGLAVLGILATVINILTLYTFITTKALRSRKHVMIINLGVAELLFVAAGIPTYAIHLLRPSISSYYMLNILHRFSKMASIFTLGAIAVERMHATVRPLRHKFLSSRVFKITIACIWTFAAIFTAFAMLQKAGVFENVFISSCLATALTIGVIATIVSCYVVIWISFRRRKRQKLGVSSTNRDKALAVTLLLVTGAFMITWSPPMLYLAIAQVCKTCIQPRAKTLGWVMLVFSIQSLINPIIYCFRLPLFKASLKGIVKRMYSKCFNRRRSTKQSAIHPEREAVQELCM